MGIAMMDFMVRYGWQGLLKGMWLHWVIVVAMSDSSREVRQIVSGTMLVVRYGTCGLLQPDVSPGRLTARVL
jgi:hypothetical protein